MTQLSQAETIRGKIFPDTTGEHVPKFFTFENDLQPEKDQLHSTVKYKDADGKLLVEEHIDYAQGKLTKYTYNQLQLSEEGTIEVKDGKVFYHFKNAKGISDENEIVEGTLLVGDNVPTFIRANWDLILKDETIKARFLSVEMKDNFGFKFFKNKEYNQAGKDIVEITMKPSSFFIALLVPKIFLRFEKNPPHKLVEIMGRYPVRVPEVFPPQKRSDYHAINGRMELE